MDKYFALLSLSNEALSRCLEKSLICCCIILYEEIRECTQAGVVNHVDGTSLEDRQGAQMIVGGGIPFSLSCGMRKRRFGTRAKRGEEFIERLLSFPQTCRIVNPARSLLSLSLSLS